MQDALSIGSSLTTRYHLQQVLGHEPGGFLYRAVDRQQQRAVWIMEHFPARARRVGPLMIPATDELPWRAAWRARLAAWQHLGHASALRVLDVLDLNGTTYAVLPAHQGETLTERVRVRGPLPPGEVTRLAEAASEVMAALHTTGLVDGAFCPDRIFCVGDLMFVGPGWAVPVGAPYVAPEVMLAQQAPTPASDVYGLAASLLFALQGAPPPAANIRTSGTGLPSLPSETPRALKHALHEGLALVASERPQTAAAFRAVLAGSATPSVSSAPVRVRGVQAHGSWVTHIAFYGDTVMSAGADHVVCSSHPQQRRATPWATLSGRPTGLVTHDDWVAVADVHGRLMVWQRGSYSSAQQPEGITQLAWLSAGQHLLTANDDNTLSLWDAVGPRPRHHTPRQAAWISALDTRLDSLVVLIGLSNGTVQPLNTQTSAIPWTWSSGGPEPVTALNSWADVVAVAQGTTVSLVQGGRTLRAWSCPEEVASLRVAPDRTTLLAAGRGGTLLGLTLDSRAQVRALYQADSPLRCLAVSRERLAFGADDGKLYVAGWDLL